MHFLIKNFLYSTSVWSVNNSGISAWFFYSYANCDGHRELRVLGLFVIGNVWYVFVVFLAIGILLDCELFCDEVFCSEFIKILLILFYYYWLLGAFDVEKDSGKDGNCNCDSFWFIRYYIYDCILFLWNIVLTFTFTFPLKFEKFPPSILY